MDGVGYNVKYKNGKIFNQFYYSNPKTYYRKLSQIDELQNFMEILNTLNQSLK